MKDVVPRRLVRPENFSRTFVDGDKARRVGRRQKCVLNVDTIRRVDKQNVTGARDRTATHIVLRYV